MKVLIMGRTNVGKSSLFNRLIKKRKSLVIDEAGITRDILREKTHWWGHDFEVIDSGGVPFKKDELSIKILEKVDIALLETDSIIFMVSAKESLHSGDFEVLQKIRKSAKPFLLFINKVDNPSKTTNLTMPFYELHSDFISGSVENNYAVDEIIEWIISQKKQFTKISNKKENSIMSQTLKKSPLNTTSEEIRTALENTSSKLVSSVDASSELVKDGSIDASSKLLESLSQGVLTEHVEEPLQEATKTENPLIQVFVIGRANSGKSMLCNQILGFNRMIVSSKSGTTLDTVTDFFSYNKMDYSISDNPGARRGNREEREKISFAKSRSELEKADIVLLVSDAQLKPSRQEAKLTQLCLEKQKPVILVLNKMDLVKKASILTREDLKADIEKVFHFYPDLPVAFVSAKTGYHKEKLFKEIESLNEKIHFRVSTSKLNNFFSTVIKKAPAPVYGTNDVKFYYINQTRKKPPEFIAFTNYPKGVTNAYRRFIIKQIKQEWDLQGIPIAFHALKKR